MMTNMAVNYAFIIDCHSAHATSCIVLIYGFGYMRSYHLLKLTFVMTTSTRVKLICSSCYHEDEVEICVVAVPAGLDIYKLANFTRKVYS